jgi:RimJ/RimL family protein N-acetyltransferase
VNFARETARIDDEMQLSVRPLVTEDFDKFIGYWTGLSHQDIERMGIAVDRMPSAEQMRKDLEVIATQSIEQLSNFILVWSVNGEAVGHSSLREMVRGERASVHLHMWRADLRGKGYGPRLFCLAALDFYERFALRNMICEPKSDNPFPNRMLRKIGFPLIRVHVAAASTWTVVSELNRYAILRHIVEHYLQVI